MNFVHEEIYTIASGRQPVSVCEYSDRFSAMQALNLVQFANPILYSLLTLTINKFGRE